MYLLIQWNYLVAVKNAIVVSVDWERESFLKPYKFIMDSRHDFIEANQQQYFFLYCTRTIQAQYPVSCYQFIFQSFHLSQYILILEKDRNTHLCISRISMNSPDSYITGYNSA